MRLSKMKLYMKKENRDKVWKNIPKKIRKYVRRTSEGPALLHPMYVEDYERQLSKSECGFGNTLYKTFFAKIYSFSPNYKRLHEDNLVPELMSDIWEQLS